jgi:hypothetical protein
MAKDARHGKAEGKAEDAGSSSLTAAAAALEADLERFDSLAATIKRMPLNSRKNLERAARALQEAAGYEEVIGGRLRALVEALNAASTRQKESAEIMTARGREIGARSAEYAEMSHRFVALGEEGKRLGVLALEVAAVVPGETEDQRIERVSVRLDDLIERMGRVVTGASELARAADAKDMGDLAREADTLKQQVAAARNKLNLLRQSLPAGAPANGVRRA